MIGANMRWKSLESCNDIMLSVPRRPSTGLPLRTRRVQEADGLVGAADYVFHPFGRDVGEPNLGPEQGLFDFIRDCAYREGIRRERGRTGSDPRKRSQRLASDLKFGFHDAVALVVEIAPTDLCALLVGVPGVNRPGIGVRGLARIDVAEPRRMLSGSVVDDPVLHDIVRFGYGAVHPHCCNSPLRGSVDQSRRRCVSQAYFGEGGVGSDVPGRSERQDLAGKEIVAAAFDGMRIVVAERRRSMHLVLLDARTPERLEVAQRDGPFHVGGFQAFGGEEIQGERGQGVGIRPRENLEKGGHRPDALAIPEFDRFLRLVGVRDLAGPCVKSQGLGGADLPVSEGVFDNELVVLKWLLGRAETRDGERREDPDFMNAHAAPVERR
ncbi:hypothetical protein ACVWWO_006407 [Bradyrhizobium sp. F1.13.1]